ncbi:MAG: hypothetical protein V1809_12165 [Planctomycetota bacterium]
MMRDTIVLLFVGALLGAAPSGSPEPVKAPVMLPGGTMEGFQYTHQDPETREKKWNLSMFEVSSRQGSPSVTGKKPVLRVFGTEELMVTADEGRGDMRREMLVAKGNVHAVIGTRGTLDTGEMAWDGAAGKAEVPGDFVYREGGTEIRGRGLVLQGREKLTVRELDRVISRQKTALGVLTGVEPPKAVPAGDAGETEGQPIEIRAKGPATYDRATGVIVLRDRVEAVQGGVALNTDLMTVWLDADRKHVVRALAEGHVVVVLRQEGKSGTGRLFTELIEVEPDTGAAVLKKGGKWVEQE